MVYYPAISAFFRAVFWGAVWGGGFLLPFSVAGGIGVALDGEILDGLGLALIPLFLAGAGTLAGMLVIGLPLTALLRHLRREREGTYGLIGTILGLLLPSLVIIFAHPDSRNLAGLAVGLPLGLFCMFAGMATGHTWGGWRERCAIAKRETRPAPNPIHDLIH